MKHTTPPQKNTIYIWRLNKVGEKTNKQTPHTTEEDEQKKTDNRRPHSKREKKKRRTRLSDFDEKIKIDKKKIDKKNEGHPFLFLFN